MSGLLEVRPACPEPGCGSRDVAVSKSQVIHGARYLSRQCRKCGRRWRAKVVYADAVEVSEKGRGEPRE